MVLQWRVLNSRVATEDNADDVMRFQMGRYGDAESTGSMDFTKMSSEQLMDLYIKATDAVGLHVDPKALTKNNRAEAKNGG